MTVWSNFVWTTIVLALWCLFASGIILAVLAMG